MVQDQLTLSQLSCLSLFDSTIRLSDFFKPIRPVRALIPEVKMAAVEAVESWCRNNGARVLYPGHCDYPASFLQIPKQPLFLSFWGEAIWRSSPCISIVGSRDPGRLPLDWLEAHFSEFLKLSRAVTVSGGARGIDQRVHALSLRAGLPTVVFLPSGLARAYPPEISGWAGEILQNRGAILSPYPPIQAIRRSHFEGRNRLIAALGSMLFVVEASRRSGSIMTARLARELGKTICALPSFPSDPRSAGSLDLIFDGAQPIRDVDDLRTLFDLCRPSPTSLYQVSATPDAG